MPLAISTTNDSGLTLRAIVDKVAVSGVELDPAQRWNNVSGDFEDSTSVALADAKITLTEDGTIDGLYYGSVEDINGTTENLRITILDNSDDTALGTAYSIPLPNVNPEVSIDLTVEEVS